MNLTSITQLKRIVAFSGWIEILRSRLLFKSLDAVLTASLRPKSKFVTYLRSILSLKSSNYERIAAVVNLSDVFIPGTAEHICAFLLRPSRLPFDDVPIQMINFGSGGTIFLLKYDKPSVLKIYRRSLGMSLAGVREVVRIYKTRYELVASWYNGPFTLVPPAQFLILHGPILGRQAAALVQPFIIGEIKDFFEDFTDDELVGLMRRNSKLRRQFLFFAEQTFNIVTEQRMCVDFIGRENLVIVIHNGNLNLMIIDTGIFELERVEMESPIKYSKIKGQLFRLRKLCTMLKS